MNTNSSSVANDDTILAEETYVFGMRMPEQRQKRGGAQVDERNTLSKHVNEYCKIISQWSVGALCQWLTILNSPYILLNNKRPTWDQP